MSSFRGIRIANQIDEIGGFEEGILYVTDNQTVIDFLKSANVPVAGYEKDNDSNLKCDYLFMDLDEVEDEDFEAAYLREKGLPLFIADTARTIIRELSLSDIDELFKLYKHPEVTRFMEPLFDYNVEIEYEKNYIEYIYKFYGYGMWLVFDKETRELIGRAGIETRDESCLEENQAELGYVIRPDLWKRGLAYEVCSKIIKLAREKYRLNSLIARCDKENLASIGLLEKLGFRLKKELDGNDLLFYLKL